MDETTKSIIDRVTARYPAPRSIESGHHVSVFYDCKRLTPNELARLAAEATGDLHANDFDIALGIAYNGIFFASAVAGGRQVAILQTDDIISGPSLANKKVIIVDDVVHSGRRLFKAEDIALEMGAEVIGYVCIVDRSDGKVGSSAKPLWSAYQTNME